MEKKLVGRVIGLVKPYRRRLALAMFSMVMVSAMASAQAYLVKPLLDQIFVEKNVRMLNILPLALVLVFLIKGIFYYTYTSVLDITGQTIIMDLRSKIFVHIHSLPISFFYTTTTGELISRVINDVTLIQRAVSRTLIGVLKDCFQVIGLIGVVLYLNWKLALISLVFLPLGFLPVIRFGRKFRQLSTTNQQIVAKISNLMHETITGHRIVKAFGMERYEIGRFQRMLDALLGVIVNDIKINSLQHPFMEFLGGVGVAAIIWYGGHQVIVGESTPGTFMAFLAALVMIYDPIKGISDINSPVQKGLAAAERVFSLLDIKSDIVDAPDAYPLPSFHDTVCYRNVSFCYADNTRALDGIDLTVAAGEVVAIVGPSGGGKSTLVNLLPRFFEVTEGGISIDGHDLRKVTMESLRKQIAIVSQQTILFNDTVRSNIAYGDLDKNEEELRAAARAANALSFIEELPEGFDTIIGESGARLSGGQSQRLSIARALLKNAPILILDEATSALDTESEREVQRALENLMKDRTTLVIAHRLSTIKNADRIVVIDRGKIVEQGAHEELLAKKGTYAELYNMQFESV